MRFIKATPLPYATKLDTAENVARFKQHSLIGGNLILNDGHPGAKVGNAADNGGNQNQNNTAPNNFDNIDKSNLDLYTQIRPIIN